MQDQNKEWERKQDELKKTNPNEWRRRNNYGHWYSKDEAEKYRGGLHAVEIDAELQHLLRGKGFKVIGSDFLQFNTPYNFNLIVMNPPFESGAKHLLKAWDIMNEGDIACLLNAETIENAYTKERKQLAEIISKYGEVEHVGQPFIDSNRPTSVEVVLVRLKKVAQEKLGLFDDPKFSRVEEDGNLNLDEIKENEIATRDVIGNLVRQYNQAAEYYIEYRRACRKMNSMKKQFDFYSLESQEKTIQDPSYNPTPDQDQKDYNGYLKSLTEAAWRTVFRLTGFEKKMTVRVKKEFEKNRQDMLVMEFTEENIYNVLETLLGASTQIAKQCILDVYDELTKYYKENLEVAEGWKSNNAYRVKRKFISPRGVTRNYSNEFDVDYRLQEGILGDIDKAMCFIDGKRIESIDTIYDTIKEKSKEIGSIPSGSVDTNCESTFFEIKFYKKGTLHLTFKDKNIWTRFNNFVAKERGWLQDYEAPKNGAKVKVYSEAY